MSGTPPTSSVPPEALRQSLRPLLFPGEEGVDAYAVLDGASIPDLLDHLYAEDGRPEFVCLYRGELEPDIAEVAPYLVRLQPGAPFTAWLLAEGWGKHWGIYALSQADLKSVRRHFRKFLMVKDPEGNQMYFRFYDPRVLRVFLPTCNAEELQFLFGPVVCYGCEGETPAELVRLGLDQGGLTVKAVALAPPGLGEASRL